MTIGSPSDSRFLRPRLPPELQLMVLDAAKYDLNTLSACSLATKSWLSTSRAHLFREVSLVANRHTAHRFTDFLKFIRELPRSGLGSDIAQCIVGLDLDGELVDLRPGIDPEDEDHAVLREFYVPVAFDTIRALASALPRLQNFTFHFILFYDDNHLGHDSWWSPPAQVTDTTGTGVVPPLPNPEDADASGPALPSICNLGVYQCSAPDDDARLLIYVLSLFASIKQLIIESGSWEITTELDEVLDTLPTSNLPDIDGLQLTDVGPDCTEAFGDILQGLASLGSHMRSLVLGPELHIEHAFESCLPVLTSAHLRKLTLNLFHLVDSITAATPLPWSLILPNLPGLTSLNLNLSCYLFGEEITKEIRSDGISNAVRVYASILAFSAALNRVPSLHTVRFAVFDGVIAPSVFRRSARTSETAVWKALGDALVALPSLGEVQFVLHNTSEPVSEEWVPSEITKKKMNSFVEEFMPQLAGKAAGKEQLGMGSRYRVMLESEEEDEPWRCHD